MTLLVERRHAQPVRLRGKVELFRPLPKVLAGHPVGLSNGSHRKESVVRFRSLDATWEPDRVSVLEVWVGDGEWYRSGCRSLIYNEGCMYRLKGARFDNLKISHNEGVVQVDGAQLAEDADHEIVVAEFFNQQLKEQGFPICMTPVGCYQPFIHAPEYQLKIPIFAVSGDTRLDELLYITERLSLAYITASAASLFYEQVGLGLGTLLRCMHNAGLVWSDARAGSNVHAGNVVVFPYADRIGLGLVDLDSSIHCDECSGRMFQRLKNEEKEKFHRALWEVGTAEHDLRFYTGHFAVYKHQGRILLGKAFQEGYRKGVYNPFVERRIFDDYFSTLREVAQHSLAIEHF
ncbi:MAG TPA: hypothetical protein VJB87_02160 [Candidatus Nanoarchaeia archaeon]|nr:hypothetical protein [Candidatus Nanoarchaeia archaeon]